MSLQEHFVFSFCLCRNTLSFQSVSAGTLCLFILSLQEHFVFSFCLSRNTLSFHSVSAGTLCLFILSLQELFVFSFCLCLSLSFHSVFVLVFVCSFNIRYSVSAILSLVSSVSVILSLFLCQILEEKATHCPAYSTWAEMPGNTTTRHVPQQVDWQYSVQYHAFSAWSSTFLTGKLFQMQNTCRGLETSGKVCLNMTALIACNWVVDSGLLLSLALQYCTVE